MKSEVAVCLFVLGGADEPTKKKGTDRVLGCTFCSYLQRLLCFNYCIAVVRNQNIYWKIHLLQRYFVKIGNKGVYPSEYNIMLKKVA